MKERDLSFELLFRNLVWEKSHNMGVLYNVVDIEEREKKTSLEEEFGKSIHKIPESN